MKKLRLLPLGAALGLILAWGGCSKTPQGGGTPATAAAPATRPVALRAETVEVACGACVYHLPGVKQCTLAARINGTPMLVTGDDVDLHGHGLCSAPGEAVVSGTVEGDTLVATSVEVQ